MSTQALLPGKVPGISTKTVHFPPHGMRLLGRSSRTCLGKCLVYRHSEKEHLLDLGWNGGFVAKSGQSNKSPKCICLIISIIHLSGVLDIVKVLKSAFLRNDTLHRGGRATGSTSLSRCSRGTCRFHPRGKCRTFPRKRCTFPLTVMKIQQREKTSRPRL